MLKVTATNLPRVLTCNGSVSMPQAPAAETDNTVKDEGNAADWLIDQVVSGQHLIEELTDRKAPNGVYITAEMVEHLEEYLEHACKDGNIEVECNYQREGIWEVRGRADHIVYEEKTSKLIVSDFKYGWRIVDPKENWTLISHAIGWCLNNFTPKTVEFRIYQPRAYHPDGYMRSWSVEGRFVIDKMKEVFTNLDSMSNGLNTSKHCYKCPSYYSCPAVAMSTSNAIDVSSEEYVSQPNNDELEYLIDELKAAQERIKQSLSSYEDLAKERLKKGEIMKNYSVVKDYGREKYKDNVTPELVEILSGSTEVTKKTLLTPKQLVKLGVNEDVVKSLTYRPEKGLQLVRMSAREIARQKFNKN